MSDDEAPKSAYELAMARLKQKDKEAGISDRPITEDQRARIAEARKVAEARFAEREIMYKSATAGTFDPEAREKLDEEYRRDRDRIASDRDRKLEDIRGEK